MTGPHPFTNYHGYHSRISAFTTRVADGDFVGDLRREKLYDFNHQSLEPSSINKLKKGPGNTLSNEKNPDRFR